MDLPETDSLDNSALIPPVILPDAASVAVPPPRPIRIVRDGILAFVCSIALTLGFVIVVTVAAMILGFMKYTPGSAFTPTPGLMVALLVAAEIPFALSAVILRWRYRSAGRSLPLLFEGTRASAILLGIGSGVLLMGFGTLHAAVAERLFGRATTDAMEELARTMMSIRGNPGMAIVLVLLIAGVAPLCEEFFFRGAIFSSVRSTERARAGAIVSSLLFAGAHGNPMMFTYYLVFGFTMCWLLSRTRTMAASIAAHVTVNAIACVAMLMAPTP
jgi:membrane protease YdiL (CAAX protease family)